MVTYSADVTDDDRVFKALADPTRRFLLDLLFARDGRTLTELESEVEMTRFGVMKHLKVLEEAGLVVTRRSGREKLHFLNPVPIRQVHDRWIDKYTERHVAALIDLKRELESSHDEHRAPARAGDRHDTGPPDLHQGHTRTDLAGDHRQGVERPLRVLGARRVRAAAGGTYRSFATEEMKQASAAMGWELPEVIVDGEVEAVDPPRRLVQTWRMLMDPAAAAEGFSRLTWEIEGPGQDGVCRLTVTHELACMPSLYAMTSGDNEFGAMGGGGWPWILSDLKSLLETGEAFPKG